MTEPLIFAAVADPDRPGERFSVSRAGEVLATAVVSTVPDYPDALRVQVAADDDAAWAVAMDGLVTTLRGRTGRLLAVARQDHRDAARLVAAGFRMGWESWGARLELPPEGLPAGAYEEFVAGPLAAGYNVRELTDADGAPLTAAFELYRVSHGDFPRTPATSMPRYTVEEFVCHISGGRLFAAMRDGEVAAITLFEGGGADRSALETDFTLVAAGHRGRNLATFLKAVAIRTLAAEGVRSFGTGGALVNKAMLRSNEKLGYVLDPLWGSYELELEPKSSSAGL